MVSKKLLQHKIVRTFEFRYFVIHCAQIANIKGSKAMHAQKIVRPDEKSPVFMDAMVIKKFGRCDVFEKTSLPKPRPARHEVLIRVRSTSINPIDVKIRNGSADIFAPAFPAILHGDVAGVIEDLGPDVPNFEKGQEVYGCVGGVTGQSGTLAEYVVADASLIARKPKNIDFPSAGSIPLVAITAWEALIDRANLQEGQRVLIHGGLGGVGHVAIQIAKSRGAVVHTTVSSEEGMPIVHELGADAAINYREEPVADYVQRLTGSEGYDIVLDTVGGENLERSFSAARVGGTVVTLQGLGKIDLSQAGVKGLTLHAVLMLLPMLTGKGRRHHGQILHDIAKLVEDGRVRIMIGKKFCGLERISEAHAYFESGGGRGKVSLEF